MEFKVIHTTVLKEQILLFSEVAVRIPVMRQNHIPIGWTIWQNATIGLEYQFGDTWTR